MIRYHISLMIGYDCSVVIRRDADVIRYDFMLLIFIDPVVFLRVTDVFSDPFI